MNRITNILPLMANYLDIQKEETLKAQVFQDYFDKGNFAYEPNIGNIDFIVTDVNLAGDSLIKAHYLWAEAKKGEADEISMITQLILTCKKTYDSGVYLPPPFIGCFDSIKIAFLPFHDILPVFTETDINWNTAPSNYLSDDFIKARKKVAKLMVKNMVVFDFDEDRAEIKSFITQHFISGMASTKSPITKNNFPHIYNRWLKEVKPTINISAERWQKYKKEGILDCDFFRADMMSAGGNTITEKLKIVLENDKYKLQKDFEGELFKTEINFTDGGAAYRRFWNKYARPPAQEYQQYIIDRRDLLVPQNIREIKGSFFTPRIWVEKSQEYIEKVFGDDWQEKYYVWDCAAGTGNLLAGLQNPYNVWASDIDQPNVDTMRAMIDEGLNLLPAHVFQFDFLNDRFDKLPKELKKIIDDPEKRKRLIVYINPPYAESGAGIGKGINKSSVVKHHDTHNFFLDSLGKASHELFSQFMARVFYTMPCAHFAVFSTLKYLNSYNFRKFRKFFQVSFKKGFICKANTFDNVNGEFPIGFSILEISYTPFPKKTRFDILDIDAKKIGVKTFYRDTITINAWIHHIDDARGETIGVLHSKGIDFQNNQGVWICINRIQGGGSHFIITKNNLCIYMIYFTVRNSVKHTWINHNDQFLYPNNGWEKDVEFQNNCVIYALFADKNRIQSMDGVNHWIPFTEKAVNAQEKFESNFMSNYLKGKTFSSEAQEVLHSGLELWKYYHKKIKGNNTVSVNASFYDIREYFQGRNDKGTMKTKSTDEQYNKLIKDLRNSLSLLAEKIQPKVYEYGFLKE